MIYAGIGSRKTPADVLNLMTAIGRKYALNGWLLRSGAAGADTAFARDVKASSKQIFTINHSKNHPTWFEHAAKFHPAWDRCGEYAKMLHARNSPIIMGEKLNRPASCVICWTDGAGIIGGTGQAMRIAIANDIPIYNLASDDVRRWYEEWCNI